jgi:hypothetical protein
LIKISFPGPFSLGNIVRREAQVFTQYCGTFAQVLSRAACSHDQRRRKVYQALVQLRLEIIAERDQLRSVVADLKVDKAALEDRRPGTSTVTPRSPGAASAWTESLACLARPPIIAAGFRDPRLPLLGPRPVDRPSWNRHRRLARLNSHRTLPDGVRRWSVVEVAGYGGESRDHAGHMARRHVGCPDRLQIGIIVERMAEQIAIGWFLLRLRKSIRDVAASCCVLLGDRGAMPA